jgi:hypothetical protein
MPRILCSVFLTLCLTAGAQAQRQSAPLDPCDPALPAQVQSMPTDARAAVLKQLADMCSQAKLSDKPVYDTAPQNGPDDTNTTWGYAARFTPDGKRIVSAGFDLKVRVWDTATGRHLKVLADIPDRPRYLAISLDGKRVAVSIDKVGVRVFDLEKNAQLGEIA